MDILEKIREMLEAGKISKEDIERAFPQLKETEDEKIRKALINLISNDKAAGYTGFYKEAGITCDDAIAYLENQKEQQPAEWSEEDEKIRQDIENLIIFALKEGSAVSPAAETTKEQAIDWLKSLRPQPHWKPSEEQMTVLEIACKYEGVFTQGQLSVLLDLKEQLKKL